MAIPLMNRVRRKIIRVESQLLHRKVLRSLPTCGLISFTFDDFPRSAYLNGGRILNSYQVKGTYYAAFGLMGEEHVGLPQFTQHDVESLIGDGHELGCHTFSHTRCEVLGPSGLAEEIQKNRAFFSRFSNPGQLENFSYPFGGINPATKKIVAELFSTGRTNLPGLNSGTIDLAYLRANRLYSNTVVPHDIEKLISECERRRGWLIFYTHDVMEDPSPYGCTPDLFEWAISAAVSSKCQVRNVRAALDALTGSSQGTTAGHTS